MKRSPARWISGAVLCASLCAAASAAAADGTATSSQLIAPAVQRFQSDDAAETPDFQRHVVPLLGKLGCNSRACHGSFQGRGGFRLSLFGYDFKMDYEGLSERIDTDAPAESYALEKPTLTIPHEGGRRMQVGSWEYHLFLNWIKGGAHPRAEDAAALVRLEVTPRELQFRDDGQRSQLKAVAVWSDGSQEDVTCLSRFQTNDGAVAEITAGGQVTSTGPGDTHVVVFYDNAVVPIPVLRPVSDQTDDRFPVVATPTPVDERVVEKLRKLGIVPADRCSDAEFLRRVSLDISGTLPTAEEVRAFVADPAPDKRSRKIDSLLETPAYAGWWATRLCDITGNSDTQLNNVGISGTPSQEWYDWLYKRVAENMPYDQLVAGIVTATSRKPDEDYRAYCERMSSIYHKNSEHSYADEDGLCYYWARRNFQTTEDRAVGFAYTFMGIRIQCAQCHKHPFDQWTQQDFEQFQKFFARVQYNRNSFDRPTYQAMIQELGLDKKTGNDQRKDLAAALKEGKVVPFPELGVQRPQAASRGAKPAKGAKTKAKPGDDAPASQMARLLAGETIDLSRIADPRTALMDWLRHDPKQLFAKSIVNRVWANYFNRGIVEPTDDMSLANPPSNAALLDYLSQGFVAHGYDLKWLHREICNSDTYQRSWRPNASNEHDERNFSRAVPRRLPAEVAYDAVQFATADDQRQATYLTDLQGRAIAVPGTGRGRNENYALTIFGRSTRESNCDCDRSAEASLLQTVFLRNDNDVLAMIERSKEGWVAELAQEFKISYRPGAEPSAPAKPGKTANTGDQANVRRLKQELTQAEAALAKAQSKGYKPAIQQAERQIEQLQRQITQAQRSRRDVPGMATSEPAPRSGPPVKVSLPTGTLVEDAYLRTLSRFPTDEERTVAVAFLDQADDTLGGVRDLLWTLVNTKEFIVNH